MIPRLLETIAELVREHHFDVQQASRIADAILRLDERSCQASDLPDLLNAVLFEISGDAHLAVLRNDRPPSEPFISISSPQRNIVVITILRFPTLATPATLNDIQKVMADARTADRLIFDVRNNEGGSGASVACVTSYLTGPEPVLLARYFGRDRTAPTESWTTPIADFSMEQPVDVLVSRTTFSAAEEFAYNLKQLGRARIIGERTRGGAHPSRSFTLSDTLRLRVPVAETVNPVSGTNWEGVGVQPDIECDANDALQIACSLN